MNRPKRINGHAHLIYGTEAVIYGIDLDLPQQKWVARMHVINTMCIIANHFRIDI